MFLTIATAILGGARKAISGLLGIVVKYPWQVALLATLALSWWQWSGKQDALAKLAACETQRKADRQEWELNVAAAQVATEKAEEDSKDAAQSAQETVDALRATNDGLRAYIARNRLQREARPAVAASASEDQDTAVPQVASAVPLVAMSEEDVNVCDADYIYAVGAFEREQELTAKGLAE